MASLTLLTLNKTYFVRELRALGHTVYTAGPSRSQSPKNYELTSEANFDIVFDEGAELTQVLRKIPDGRSPTHILYYDDSSIYPTVRGIDRVNTPKVFYSIDAHLHSVLHPIFGAMFDLVLVAQPDYLSRFQKFNPQSQWFPLWSPLTVETSQTRDIAVCFRGSLDPETRPKRRALVYGIAERCPLDHSYSPYTEAFPRAKIILNEALNADVNFRVFEATMCGGLLLNPHIGNGLSELFDLNKEIVTYKPYDIEDACAKIEYYLSHEQERAEIAQQGQARTRRCHTAEVRAAQLETLLINLSGIASSHAALAASYLAIFHSKFSFLRAASQSSGDLRHAAQRIVEALSKEHSPSPELMCAIVDCKHMYETLGADALALQFTESLHQTAPQHPLIGACLIDSLLRMRRSEDALKIAGLFSDRPSEFVAQAPSWVEKLLSSALAKNTQLVACD